MEIDDDLGGSQFSSSFRSDSQSDLLSCMERESTTDSTMVRVHSCYILAHLNERFKGILSEVCVYVCVYIEFTFSVSSKLLNSQRNFRDSDFSDYNPLLSLGVTDR